MPNLLAVSRTGWLYCMRVSGPPSGLEGGIVYPIKYATPLTWSLCKIWSLYIILCGRIIWSTPIIWTLVPHPLIVGHGRPLKCASTQGVITPNLVIFG